MDERTLNLNLTWEDDDPRLLKTQALNRSVGIDFSCAPGDFSPPLCSTPGSSRDISFEWPSDESTVWSHPDDPDDLFRQPPQHFDDTLQAQPPCEWRRKEDSAWSRIARPEGLATSTMFLEESALDLTAPPASCTRGLPWDWPDRSDSLFPNPFPPAWEEGGPCRTGTPGVATTADNVNVTFTTQKPALAAGRQPASRIPRLKPTHDPRPAPAPPSRIPVLVPQGAPAAPAGAGFPPGSEGLQGLLPPSRIPVLVRQGAPVQTAYDPAPSRFPPGMEGLLQEGPFAAEGCPDQAMRIHMRGCKGACGGTERLGGCVTRKYGRI